MISRTTRLGIFGTITLWVVAFLALSAGFIGMQVKFPLEMAERRAATCVFGVLLCLVIGRVHVATNGWRFPYRLALGLGLAIVASVLYSEANFAVFYLIHPLWGKPDPGLSGHIYQIIYTMRLMVWVFLAWNALYFAVEYDDAVRQQQLRLAAAQALAVDARNRMLRYQINPHFLFNTLNTLSTLVLDGDNARAERVILALSAFLRHSLEKDLGDKIPLGDEIDVQTKYLSIEQIRFGDRMVFTDRVPEDLRAARVPSLILQPLVENAAKHGVGVAAGRVNIELSASRIGNQLEVTLTDDAVPSTDALSPPKLGVGLENVRRRLLAEYGPSSTLTCTRRQPSGFTVTLRMPLDLP